MTPPCPLLRPPQTMVKSKRKGRRPCIQSKICNAAELHLVIWCLGLLVRDRAQRPARSSLTCPASCAHPLHAADEAAARLGKETGHPERVAALTVDISEPKSIEAAAQTLERDYAGKLGGLINNAAVR